MKNWDDIRYLLAIADTGSISGAARLLHVDHATVSRRLNSLEDSLQNKLVNRTTRSCYLTLTGQKIAALAKQMEETSFAIDRLALAAQFPVSGTVSVSAPPILATHFLAKCLHTFHQRYPDITLNITSSALRASLSKQEADIALRLIRPVDNNDVARKIGTMPFALYASIDYLHRDKPNTWEFIGYDKAFSEMPHAKWIVSTAGDRKIVCSFSDIVSQIEAVKSGVGVGSIPQFIGDKEQKLVQLPYHDDIFSPEIWLAVHSDMRSSPIIRLVLDFITTIAKEYDFSS